MRGFFDMFRHKIEWRLKPQKYTKDSPNNYSSKVLMPYQVLVDLVSNNIQPPYIFEIQQVGGHFSTYCSVLDFQLEEDEAFLPSWMYEQLSLDSAIDIILKPAKLIIGKGVKLQPHKVEFLNLENPKQELERVLRNYHVLSLSDEILLNLEGVGPCRFTITKINPKKENYIYIVDTDLEADFDEPIGYKEYLEDQKSVNKYFRIEKTKEADLLKFDKIGYFCDWESIMNSE